MRALKRKEHMETYKKIIETRKNLMSDSNCSFEFPEHEIKDFIEGKFIGVLNIATEKDSTEKLNLEIFNLDTDIDKLELKNLELVSHIVSSIKNFNSTHKKIIISFKLKYKYFDSSNLKSMYCQSEIKWKNTNETTTTMDYNINFNTNIQSVFDEIIKKLEFIFNK